MALTGVVLYEKTPCRYSRFFNIYYMYFLKASKNIELKFNGGGKTRYF